MTKSTTTSRGFVHDLAGQLRAGDTYGRFDRFPDEHLLKPFILAPADRTQIAVNCDVDPHTEERVRTFYQAVAAGTERLTSVMTAVVVDLSHEGFGRAIIFAGRLVVVADVLRDAQRFGFPTIEALSERGEALVASAVETLKQFPAVADDAP
jgi:probable nitrogen fixation protein